MLSLVSVQASICPISRSRITNVSGAAPMPCICARCNSAAVIVRPQRIGWLHTGGGEPAWRNPSAQPHTPFPPPITRFVDGNARKTQVACQSNGMAFAVMDGAQWPAAYLKRSVAPLISRWRHGNWDLAGFTGNWLFAKARRRCFGFFQLAFPAATFRASIFIIALPAGLTVLLLLLRILDRKST